MLAQAVAHHQAGRVAEAECGYRDVLAADPRNADALHLLGVLALQSGHADEAVTLIGKALAQARGVADYWDNLGSALFAAGRPDEAAQAHRNATILDPQGAQRRHNLGNALAALGRHDEAQRAFASALALKPDYAKAWYNLGNGHAALHRYDGAVTALDRAVRLAPSMVEAHNNLGDALAMAGRLDEAIAQHRLVTRHRPDDATAFYNLGAVLQQKGAFESAEIAYRQALKRNPRHSAALNNLGSVLKRLGRPDQAELCHRQALDLHPEFVEARYNLGNALQAQGRYEEAAACFEEALAQQPDLATATYNLSLLALLHGDIARGWAGYERRFAAGEAVPNRRFPIPRWDGAVLRGKRLLIWREQGVGDEMMFASCYPDVVAWAGGPVTIECDPRLVPLFRRSFPKATVRAESCTGDAFGEPLRETIDPPDCDLQVAAGDLPELLRGSLSAFEPQGPWLVADPALVERWRQRLAALGPGLRVGIGWRSQLMTADRKASYVMLEHWGPLFAVPGLVFVNLQYGECEEEIRAAEERFGVTIHRWADLNLKDDFDGAAALTANLDLVISPAMSAGELAGALGVPVWRFGGRDWTQLATGARPWFPAMRLFRPNPGEGLEAAIARMASALRANATPRSRAPSPAVIGAGEGGSGTADATDPDPDPDRLLELAVGAHRSGAYDEAGPLYERVLASRPRDPVALHLSGLLAHQSGASARGEGRIAAAVAEAPEYATAHISLGNVRLALGRGEQAAASFRTALAVQPDSAAALTNLGNALDALERSAAAADLHRKAVTADPDLAEAHDNLGVALARLGRWAEAERAHAQALRRTPGLEAGWMNLSVALRRLGRLDPAERAGRRALALAPALADAMANRGRLLRELGDAAAAGPWCARALAVEPGHAAAAFNGGLLELTAGRLARGWDGYDRRFDTRDMAAAFRRPGAPLWDGGPLSGKRLLVWREQGIGDELMFAQRLPELVALADHDGGHVVVECDPRFVPLFARSFPEATVRPAPATPGEPSSDIDAHAPIGSLSRRLGGTLPDFAALGPALRADPAAIETWRRRLSGLGDGLRVGIAWRSSQLDPDRMPDYTRIEDWRPVLTLPALIPVNLQYGDCETELAAAHSTFGRAPHDFADIDLRDDLDGTAALMSALDLVIAPATSTGELAGALGVPVWRLGRTGDWTALGTGVRPWFPSMRLFWTGPGERVADLLPKVAAELERFRRTGGGFRDPDVKRPG
ncbi:hypothetical protein TSH64_27760 [Azospirillum sp. TSH64]|nr:hypothetical protein TSH64_27760 [Azospirillum sp. TSH64]